MNLKYRILFVAKCKKPLKFIFIANSTKKRKIALTICFYNCIYRIITFPPLSHSFWSLTGLVLAVIAGPNEVGQRDAPPVGGFGVWFLSGFGGFVSLSLIGKPPYIINGNTSGDSGFWGGVTNQWASGLVRDNYIAKAVGYKQNNENLTWNFNSPANYNPLKLEPLSNVLQGDLMREADRQ